MKNLSFEKLLEEAEVFRLSQDNSYAFSYFEFIKYFENIDGDIKEHHLVVASHFVYGWMPTILNLNNTDFGRVLYCLNSAKSGHLLSEDELQIVKTCVNNSMVGASKLLHFINPKIYAIWDSKVFRYLTYKKSSYGIEKPKSYLKYLKDLKGICDRADYQDLHIKIQKPFVEHFNYSISPMRAIEVLMFEMNRRQKNK